MSSTHLHELIAVSSHRTSEGLVAYFRCECGAWEVRASGGADVAIAATRRGCD
ncbi:hypothetical protein [Nonomuraea endophytica]|uniref:hypothetical protein n=1 Tax=Nonomuraea endophytica TaxID=714136 RepID=UPI0037CB8A0C